MFKAIVPTPEELLKLKCSKCDKSLQWVDILSRNFPMDTTAEAECCGILHHAYAQTIRVWTGKADGGN
jgi:hypothetical protein